VSDPVLKACWKSADATTQRDALKFWREEHLLPDIADAAKRLRNICVVAHDGPRIVGALEARVTRLEVVRARIAMLNLAVAQERRLANLAGELVLHARQVLERWSLDNPQEKVLGIGRIIQLRKADERSRQPVWEPSKLTLVGYTPKGAQIRIAWFKHAILD
jgi:hypothetical protein